MEGAVAQIDAREALSSPFPLAAFEEKGLPAAARFLWWERSHSQGRRREGTLRSGLHALDLDAGWLEVAAPETYASAMADRRSILQEQAAAAVVDDVQSRGAQRELLKLALAHLAKVHPLRFKLDDEAFESSSEGLRWRLADYEEQPLLLAAQVLQEDICLMREEQGPDESFRHIFASGFVTDSFDPVEKHLLPMDQLHAPVPGYKRDLHKSMGRVFSTLRRPLWRANFSFYQWKYEEQAEGAEREQQILEELYVKVEYETVRRLTEHPDYLVFSIRAHMDPLISFSSAPLACAALATELRSMPQALLEYKGMGDEDMQRIVLNFLDRAAAAAAP